MKGAGDAATGSALSSAQSHSVSALPCPLPPFPEPAPLRFEGNCGSRVRPVLSRSHRPPSTPSSHSYLPLHPRSYIRTRSSPVSLHRLASSTTLLALSLCVDCRCARFVACALLSPLSAASAVSAVSAVALLTVPFLQTWPTATSMPPTLRFLRRGRRCRTRRARTTGEAANGIALHSIAHTPRSIAAPHSPRLVCVVQVNRSLWGG